jgi:hypothetical protein
MDLKQLEYFVRVAELGSFTRAAIALDVAQPALSRQVRLLEVELRQNLLARNGRGATPPKPASCCWSMAAASCTRSNARAKSWAACAARWPGAWPLACHPAWPRCWPCR